MKKLLSLLLAAVMILSFSACKKSVENTKTQKALDVFNGDTYALEMKLIIDLTVYRKVDSLYVSFPGFESYIINKKRYEFDDEKKIAYYEQLGEEEFKEELEQYLKLKDGMIDLEGAKLIGTGKAEFLSEELSYEKISLENGDWAQVYFYENDEMAGFQTENELGNMVDVKYHISKEVPDDVFTIPDGYEEVPIENAPTADSGTGDGNSDTEGTGNGDSTSEIGTSADS
jgi:hypothetical protein